VPLTVVFDTYILFSAAAGMAIPSIASSRRGPETSKR